MSQSHPQAASQYVPSELCLGLTRRKFTLLAVSLSLFSPKFSLFQHEAGISLQFNHMDFNSRLYIYLMRPILKACMPDSHTKYLNMVTIVNCHC